MIFVLPDAFAPKIRDILKTFLFPSALVSTSHRFSTFALDEVGSVVKEQRPLNDR